jgi:hypothetical protein
MSSESLLPSFDYMFALRFSYIDTCEDEHIIIRKLRNYLLEYEPNTDIIDKYLIDFYKEYNIMINDNILDDLDSDDENNYDYEIKLDYEFKTDSPNPLDNFSEADIINAFMGSIMNNSISNYNTINYDNNIIPNSLLNIYNPTLTYNSEMLMEVINNILNDTSSEFKDVVSTLDEEDFCKIRSYTQETDSDIQCSICFDNLMKDDNVSCLPCSHKYHNDCINTYLKEYNYICPVCRAEVGKSKSHI